MVAGSLPGFGSEQRACGGVWTCQGAVLPPTPAASWGGGSSFACSLGVLLCHWVGGTQGQFVLLWLWLWAGSCGTRVRHWQRAGGAGAMLCVYIHPLGAAGAQHAPQPTVALEGEALGSSMHSTPPLETHPLAPTQRVARWQGGAGKVSFCLISVMMRPLTMRAGPGGVQGHPPRQLPELWLSCPCRQPGKGAWHVGVLSHQPPPMAAQPSRGSCGMEQARGPHLTPPGRVCSSRVSP